MQWPFGQMTTNSIMEIRTMLCNIFSERNDHQLKEETRKILQETILLQFTTICMTTTRKKNNYFIKDRLKTLQDFRKKYQETRFHSFKFKNQGETLSIKNMNLRKNLKKKSPMSWSMIATLKLCCSMNTPYTNDQRLSTTTFFILNSMYY